ncbi:MAG: 30S ribosomal protein S9 [Candidatus Omnitrophota bacterium]
MVTAKVFLGTGRRKSAVARVRLLEGQKGIFINGEPSLHYLNDAMLQMTVEKPLKHVSLLEQFGVRVEAQGGGKAGQAAAVSLGIARALLEYDEKLRAALRKGGFLTRDPREKERKKPGRKGARRSFQYTKR